MYSFGIRNTDWRSLAECFLRRDEVQKDNKEMGFDIFYPPKGEGEERGEARRRTKKYCGPCLVRYQCLAEAFENDEQGTWGNETFNSRKRLARLRHKVPSELLMRERVLLRDENKPHSADEGPDHAA